MKKIKTYLRGLLLAMISSTAFQVNAQTNLEEVAALDIRPGNVSVSKGGRVFITIHPLGSPHIQLAEIKNKKMVAFPSTQLQKNGGKASNETLDTPLGLIFDTKNRLWVIDIGLELAKTRVWCFDINNGKILYKIELPADIAPRGSFIQDLAVDEKNNWIYMADIANPGIIALNLQTNKARRFGGHPSLQSENMDMVIDGKVVNFGGKPARVAVNPITLSTDRETLFFGAMTGTKWYKVPAKLFRNDVTDLTIGNSIQIVGNKPMSDGIATDKNGNHYITNLQEHTINKLSADGVLSVLIQDNRLKWPDNIAIGPNNYAYVSVNQLNLTPAFTGSSDQGKAPYYIYRFKL